MPSKLELQRLAHQIEVLLRTSTHGWHPADEMDFHRKLPNAPAPHQYKLPTPESLRAEDAEVSEPQYRGWLTTLRHMEDLIRENDPRNPKRMMRDMARGVFREARL